jgi:hypothetical protein
MRVLGARPSLEVANQVLCASPAVVCSPSVVSPSRFSNTGGACNGAIMAVVPNARMPAEDKSSRCPVAICYRLLTRRALSCNHRETFQIIYQLEHSQLRSPLPRMSQIQCSVAMYCTSMRGSVAGPCSLGTVRETLPCAAMEGATMNDSPPFEL